MDNKNHPIKIALLGFCSDEGIRRNNGRVGAKDGPEYFRKEFSKLNIPNNIQIIDRGDIACEENNLEAAQCELGHKINNLLLENYRPLIIGGGHEMAYGHYLGLENHCDDIGIINFDAHFDMREIKNNQSTSGTPFLQIAQNKKQNNFNYMVLGIQPSANNNNLFKTASEHSVKYITADQILRDNLESIKNKIRLFINNNKKIYLSVCLDVFQHSIAPGVSAPQANGLFPHQVFLLLDYILSFNKTLSLDIAELSPPYDSHNRTAKLAAHCAWRYCAALAN